MRNSIKLQRIQQLNSQYARIFCLSLNPVYTYTCHKKSKAAYDRTNFQQLLADYLSVKGSEIRNAISFADHNAKHICEYQSKYLIHCAQPSIYRAYLSQSIEQRLCKKAKLTPVTEINLNVISTYTSPKGKNFYQNSKVFSQNDILQGLQFLAKQEQFRQTKDFQRKIMTDSLRYDIMKRDGFRCTLCGASARDGIQLHVDHILPVSKGGKTTKDNLRTLCSRCNLGKGSKYDYSGNN
jgi:5-methylcytosine-specific restriction endonuclease McrA